jgi:nucleotide-binding universal stress UspA family protein
VDPSRGWNMLQRMGAPEGTVLVAFDGSAAARQAVIEAAGLLAPRRILVLTVWEPALAHAAIAGSPDLTMAPVVEPEVVLGLDSELRRNAERLALEGAELARSHGLEAEPLAVSDSGSVSGTILDVAGEQRAAAIVVGSRGLSGLRARLEGSTSSGVLKRASCPVVVVHGPDEDD